MKEIPFFEIKVKIPFANFDKNSKFTGKEDLLYTGCEDVQN